MALKFGTKVDLCMRRLKNKKAPGKDGVSNEMIKHLGPAAKTSKLLDIFNLHGKRESFHQLGKRPSSSPYPRKQGPQEENQLSTHQPAQLPRKTPERMINKRLMWHLQTNNLITKEQTAFRKNRNTEDQLIYLAQSIENAFQEKNKVIATFVDLSKAFDKVWQESLLLKLLTAGIAGRMFSWIRSFPCHRTARVRLDGSLSYSVKIREGVPQGGVFPSSSHPLCRLHKRPL